MATITELTWKALSTAINEVKTPNRFVHDLLFSNHETSHVETIGIDAWVGGRKMAPFVIPGAAAKLVPGVSTRFREIVAPNIKIKRPFMAQQFLLARQPGTPIFITQNEQTSAISLAIAKDIQYARQQIDDTLEWMCCQALTGVITYTMGGADDQKADAFTIDFARPGAHTVVQSGTGLWTDAASNVEEQVRGVKELISNAVGLDVTDCILGKLAANAFMYNTKVRADLNLRNINPGTQNLSGQFGPTGALFLGNLYGIDWWQYGRQVEDPFGTTVDLIHQKKAHYVCRSPGAENVVVFGAIADFAASESGLFVGEVFSKSWEEEDPSGRIFMAQSRPLPIPRRVESMATHQVIA